MNSLIRKAALIAALALAVPILGQGPITPVAGVGPCSQNANGAVTCTATGTNQSITLTPSGTGTVSTPANIVITGSDAQFGNGLDRLEFSVQNTYLYSVNGTLYLRSAVNRYVSNDQGLGFNSNSFGIVGGSTFALSTAPTIGSGFGTTPTVPHANGTAAFTINVGTGGTATTGTLTMPAATTGWVVHCTDVTTQNSTVDITKQIGVGTTTSVTIGNFTDLGAAGAWAASDILACTAMGY